MVPGLQEFLQALSESSIASALRESATSYLLVNAAHILSIGLIIGSIVTLDLRLLGIFGAFPLGMLAPALSRVAAIGVCLAAMTGLLLFSVRPLAYVENPAFLAKVSLVALGVLNAGALRAGPSWCRALSLNEATLRIKVGAILSLGIWSCAVVAGRWIGFLQ